MVGAGAEGDCSCGMGIAVCLTNFERVDSSGEKGTTLGRFLLGCDRNRGVSPQVKVALASGKLIAKDKGAGVFTNLDVEVSLNRVPADWEEGDIF